MKNKSFRFLILTLVIVASMLACDLPFVAPPKQAVFVEGTPQTETPSADSTATPGAITDANATPGTPGAQPTRRPATAAPRIPAGVYAVSIRLEPPSPRSGPDPVIFFVRFQNTFSEKKLYRWLMKIFRPGENKSFGETAAINSDIPVGTTEIASATNWHTNPFQCDNFIARVYWLEAGNPEPIEFKRPDTVNTSFVDFKVCP